MNVFYIKIRLKIKRIFFVYFYSLHMREGTYQCSKRNRGKRFERKLEFTYPKMT